MLTIEEVFNERTYYSFQDKPVDRKLLEEIYDLMKLGPTSFNSCPLRIIFIQSEHEKEKLYKCILHSNLNKVKSAPLAAIFAYDTKFYQNLNKLFSHSPKVQDWFATSAKESLDTAFRNSSLQAAYFMMIARSKGLACGALSGFNHDELNKTFFEGTSYKANFICNFGYKAEENPFPRLPRLNFDECCKII